MCSLVLEEIERSGVAKEMKSAGWIRQTVFSLATASKINTKVTVAGTVCSTLIFGTPLNDNSKRCHLHWILDRGESDGACASVSPLASLLGSG